MDKPFKPSKKDMLIAELEAELEKQGEKLAAAEAQVARLRAVILSARGTLGAGRL